MDSDRRSAQVELLEVVDTGRRRRWSEDEKLKIVLESLQASRQVAATARQYGVSRSLLLRWRRSFRSQPKDAAHQPPAPAEQSVDPSPTLPKIWRVRYHRVDLESAELLIQDTRLEVGVSANLSL